MKIFIENKANAGSLQGKKALAESLKSKGHTIVLDKVLADFIFIELGTNSNPPMKTVANEVYYRMKNGRPMILTFNKRSTGKSKFLKETATKDTKHNYSTEDINNLSKGIIDYLLGLATNVDILDPFPMSSVLDLLNLRLNARRSSRDAMTKTENIKAKYNLSDIAVKVLSDEVMKASRIDAESKLIKIISVVDYIHTDFFGKGIMIPNVSHSIISNIIKAYEALDIMSIAKDEITQKRYFDKAVLEVDELKVTLKNSLFSKNSWKMYSKEDFGGLYGLFIPDNSLGDCEIRIPRPTFTNIKSTITGIEIAVLKKNKIIITTEVNQEIKDYSRRMRYRIKVVDDLDSTLNNLKLYPIIGDTIAVTRHPITTLILEAKVVGYTIDGSIRINNKMIQVLEGDSDGDSLTTSWGHKVKYADKQQLDEYVRIAGINLSITKRDNLYNIDNAVKEIDTEKLTKTAIEQANAKLATANLTGSFGVAERTIILSYILAKKKIDLEVVYTRSRISQLSVQAKNILAQLQSGALSTETVDTFKAYYNAMEDKVEALNVLAAFLDTDVRSVSELIIGNVLELVEEDNKVISLF